MPQFVNTNIKLKQSLPAALLPHYKTPKRNNKKAALEGRHTLKKTVFSPSPCCDLQAPHVLVYRWIPQSSSLAPAHR